MLTYDEIKDKVLKNLISSEYTSKGYLHFDEPVGKSTSRKKLTRFCLNPNIVTHLSHFPFISFDIKFNKFKYDDESKIELNQKKRTIKLPSHQDAILLKIYGDILVQCYESYIRKNNFSNNVVAYRVGKSNITGAKDVFDFTWNEDSWIIKGDFSHFFDNLDHDLMFKQVKSVMSPFVGKKLPSDWNSILSFITKYREVKQEELEIITTSNGKQVVKGFREVGKNVDNKKLKVSKKNKRGIPQGTALSAVLANVYMLEFDQKIKALIARYGGLYRRYSDDFIIVIPSNKFDYSDVKALKQSIISLSHNVLHLQIKNEKSQVLHFNKKLEKITKEDSDIERSLDYLGFSFNGKKVFLRQNTRYRFHYRGKRAIRRMCQNTQEFRVANESDNKYEQVKEHYLTGLRNDNERIKANNRIKSIRNGKEKNFGVKGRKKITQMYLIQKPLPKQNMMDYAVRAQAEMENKKRFEKLYVVDILPVVIKEICERQREWNYFRNRI